MNKNSTGGRLSAGWDNPRPRRGWLSLRFKFILWVVSVVMYLCLGMGCVFLYLTEANVREELHGRGTSQARALAREGARHILAGDLDALTSLVRSTVEDEDVLFAEIRDSSGRPIATAGPARAVNAEGTRAPDGGPGRRAEESIEVTAPITLEHVRAPDRAGGSSADPATQSQLGTVHLRLSTTREGAAVAMISRQLAPLMVVSCVLSIVGTVLVERRITRPVAELVRATRAIASGNLGLRVSAGSHDEFGELARSFNHMADNLTVTMVKLENYSHRLEETVHQRTKELEAKTRALQQANAELQKLDGLKSEFISNVSHELRTPLTSIKAVAELLGRKGQELPGDKTVEFLKIIESQTDRLTRLIGEILDLSHLEHEGRASEPQVVSVPDAIAEAVNSVQGIATERGVRIVTHIPEDLPQASSERDKSIQVLINLLGNALKFTPEGSIIEVSARLLGKQGIWHGSPRPVSGLVVSVADAGPGIPPEQLEAIFDRFKQIKSAASEGAGGSGLGLAISKEIVERFGGTIWAESEIGVGSVFHFTMEPVREHVEMAA